MGNPESQMRSQKITNDVYHDTRSMWNTERSAFFNGEECTTRKICSTIICSEVDENHRGDPLHQHNEYNTDDFETKNEIRIVLFGRTGSGKSATGNSILGEKHFESLVSGTSVTSKCKRGETNRREKKIIVVDTPGLFDTGMTNEKISMEIVKCIGMTSPGPHAMVLVVGISRFTKEEQDTVQHFVELFGEGIYKYMIVLFTRKDELSKSNQSIHQFVQTVPMELHTILNQCGNRYIAFNNDAVSKEQEIQQADFLDLVEKMLCSNDHACYTSEIYQEAEASLQRRIRKERENLENQKKKEQDEMRRQIESKYEETLEKEKLEKRILEEKLNSTKTQEKKMKEEKDTVTKEMQSLKQQLNDRNVENKRQMEKRIEVLQQQLRKFERRNNDQYRLQKALDEINLRHQRELAAKEMEIVRVSKQMEDIYKLKMDKLRQQERDKIEKEDKGILHDILSGFEKIGSGIFRGLFGWFTKSKL